MGERPKSDDATSCDLARLISASDPAERIWRPADLGPMLRHQMATAVRFELDGLVPVVARRAFQSAVAQRIAIRSFGDLLRHPYPPVDLLILTKQYARAMLEHPERPLPEEIARVLYYASIVVARMRLGQRISTLGDDALIEGVRALLSQEWLDGPTRSLLHEGLSFLLGGSENPPTDAGSFGPGGIAAPDTGLE